MREDQILYQITIPYPWKRTLRGLLGLGIVTGVLLTALFLYADHKRGTLRNPSILGADLIPLPLILGLYVILRHILIKGDKIKEPIIIKVMTDTIVWKKAEREMVFPLHPIKELIILLTDRKMKIKADFQRYVPGVGAWWLIQLRLHDEFDTREDYKKFLNEICPDFKEVLTKQVKYLNPKVTIIEKDERRKLK